MLWYLAETVAIGISWKAYEWGGAIFGTGDATTGGAATTWRRFAHVWDDTLSNDTADRQVFTIDIANVTGGNVDSTWTDADYAAVFGQLNGLVANLAPHVPPRYTCNAIHAYVMAFNPLTNEKPFAKSGSPEDTFNPGRSGSAGGLAPPQACTTITEETPNRKHWGRFYSPTIGGASIGLDGRVTTAAVDAIAQSAHDCYEALMTSQFFPVVPVTRVDKTALRALQTVTGVRVDDVVDIQRSRRHHIAKHHKILPVVAGTQPAAA